MFTPDPHTTRPDVGPVKFATGPNDAIQLWIDLSITNAKIARVIQEANNPINDPLSGNILTMDDVRDMSHMTERAPIYFWSRDTASLVLSASQSYPLAAEEAIHISEAQKKTRSLDQPPGYVPRLLNAICVFDSPILCMDMGSGPTEPFSAIAWTVAVSRKYQELWLSLRGIQWVGSTAAVVWQCDGGSKDALHPRGFRGGGRDTFQAERMAFIKWVCTAATFIEQEIIAGTPERPARAFLKRAETAGRSKADSVCHVVRLRRERNDRNAEPAEHASVDWEYRWIVRGHWRRQWFPARQTHAPVWIHPHIKGPENKPFKEPKPTVFSVTR